MLQLPSDREEFSGVAAFYDAELRPWLEENEARRRKAVRDGGILLAIAGVVAVAALALGTFESGNFHLAIFLFVIGFVLAAWRFSHTGGKITRGLLERVCGHLGMHYSQEIGRPNYFQPFTRLKMMPSFNRESWEDEVRGARHGADFVFCEAHLKYKTSGKNSSTRTVFHGQLLVIDYHKEFLGETVVKRDAGLLNRFGKPGRNFSQVGIASPEFEKKFEAWSTDQVEARDLLDPLVLERFEELDRLFGGAKLRAAFSGGQLYLALETGDALNMGSMFKPLAGPERIETILKEFDLIFDLIDVLLKRVDGRISGAFSVDDVRSP